MVDTLGMVRGARRRGTPGVASPESDGCALPNLVVIGAMKAGTSALHRYLGMHPQIAMSTPKELNFFFGQRPASGERAWAGQEATEEGRNGSAGNWYRGREWYARHWPAASDVRGESSPGYTSPSFPEVASRMAGVIPSTRLVFVVRDPIDRAVSQYRHHQSDGSEVRPLEEALLDPRSQYLSRGCYYERLMPFLQRFGRRQIAIAAHEELLVDRRATLRRLFGWLGVDGDFWSSDLGHELHWSNGAPPQVPPRLRAALVEALAGDVDRFREVAGRDFPGWSL